MRRFTLAYSLFGTNFITVPRSAYLCLSLPLTAPDTTNPQAGMHRRYTLPLRRRVASPCADIASTSDLITPSNAEMDGFSPLTAKATRDMDNQSVTWNIKPDYGDGYEHSEHYEYFTEDNKQGENVNQNHETREKTTPDTS
ncbi:hypothetical protein CVT25_009349 [Psilocybe cyanescens]|uniref:Uncharacterized protein n=1 Tax=Psilocybe cyanescens TaxID=93625 RepID=A0A409X891_PSICY|nr:hypothetical protein CVT25_009349 [Psilocybe cyanescens]